MEATNSPGTPAWKFIGHCFDGDRFEIDGINVWEHGWHSTGQKAGVNDPLYTWQGYDFTIYTISSEGKTITFAAGEFSNTVWGFFQLH